MIISAIAFVKTSTTTSALYFRVTDGFTYTFDLNGSSWGLVPINDLVGILDFVGPGYAVLHDLYFNAVDGVRYDFDSNCDAHERTTDGEGWRKGVERRYPKFYVENDDNSVGTIKNNRLLIYEGKPVAIRVHFSSRRSPLFAEMINKAGNVNDFTVDEIIDIDPEFNKELKIAANAMLGSSRLVFCIGARVSELGHTYQDQKIIYGIDRNLDRHVRKYGVGMVKMTHVPNVELDNEREQRIG